MSWLDNEVKKGLIADQCRRKKRGGFEGCKNYPEECSFAGFYHAQYSPEGLCSDCELKKFPDRYHGCNCCGYAINYHPHFCINCRNGIEDWLSAVLNYTKRDWKIKSNIDLGIHCVLNDRLGKNPYPPKRKLEHPPLSFDHKWKGFHKGNDSFIIPNIEQCANQVNINDITWENKEAVITRELEKLKINLYDSVQYSE
jgi:hypothetical protein